MRARKPVSSEAVLRGPKSLTRARLAQRAGRALLSIGADFRVLGIDRVPTSGPLIVAGNHLSYVDGLLAPSLLPRVDTYLMVAHEFEHRPFYHFFANFIGRAIYLAPDSKSMFALRQAVAVLRAGHVVLIAPEGRVSLTGALEPGNPGIGYLAAVSGAPVLPIATIGQENLFTNLRRLRRTTVTAEFGELFVPPKTALSEAGMAATTDLIMRRIAAMLPPGYRGVYSD
jgi:1-acyl-sn-glycerol-3-phosphate acyltransferase